MTNIKKINGRGDLCFCETCRTYYALPKGVEKCKICGEDFQGRASAESAIADTLFKECRFKKVKCLKCRKVFGVYTIEGKHNNCPICGAESSTVYTDGC